MSHVATNWAFAQRGLKPATKLILCCLADRHNPDGGCFPQQSTIAEDVGLSRSTVNEHLKELEKKGLLRREARFDPRTHRQKSTRYILAFEMEFAQHLERPCPETGHGNEGELPGPKTGHGTNGNTPESKASGEGEPCPETGHGAVSGTPNEPCPAGRTSRVRKSDTNPVKGTSNRTSEAREARPGGVGETDELFDRFCGAHPNAIERDAVHRAWLEAVEAGANPARLVVLAQRYRASPEVVRGYSKKAQNWLRDGGWREDKPFPERSAARALNDMAKFWAEKINDGKFVPTSALSAAVVTRMLELALVTVDQLEAIGWRT